jgi:hypothetical protein
MLQEFFSEVGLLGPKDDPGNPTFDWLWEEIERRELAT